MIKNLLDSDVDDEVNESDAGNLGIFGSSPEPLSLFDPADETPAESSKNAESGPSHSSGSDYTPPTAGQAVRMTGLAWSAGISLFGSIIFMLIIGWFADLLLGTSPWGKVTGIVVGSVIGFIQFFRINSEILRTSKSDGKGSNGFLK